MNWKFTNDRPIYVQIVEEIQKRIISNVYPLGSSMPSVRVLALEASVNPNTMQKALVELETQELFYTQRTSGRTVTTDEGLIMELKERIASEYIEQYFEGMKSLGIERDTAAGMLVSKTHGSSVLARAEMTTMDAFAQAQAAETAIAKTPITEEPAVQAPATEEPAVQAPATEATEAPETSETSETTETFINDTSTTILEVN